MKTIGLLSAMSQELEKIQPHIDKEMIGNYQVHALLSGVGKINAAIAAQKLISEYGCEVLIFSGVAGGLHPTYKIGDIAMASRTFQHDYGFFEGEFRVHSPHFHALSGIGNGDESIYTDLKTLCPAQTWKNLEGFSQTCAQEKFAPITMGEQTYHPIFHPNATIATGDQFISNQQRNAEIRALEADAVDMESAAIAIVAQNHQIPCFIFRAISDCASQASTEDFPTFLSTVSSNNAMLVTSILQENLI